MVASEVKSLASQTAKATEEIAAQISGVRDATDANVQVIHQIGLAISEINEVATAVAAAVQEQVAAGTARISGDIADVSAIASQTESAAGSLVSVSAELGKRADVLKTELDRFLITLRAA